MIPVFIKSSLMEHLDGLGLIAPAGAEKLIELRAALLLVGGEAGPIEAPGARLRCDERGEIEELTRLQGDQLIAGLVCLKEAGGRLARGEESVGLRPGDFECLYDAGLDAQRVLIARERVLPTGLRVAGKLLGRGRGWVALRIGTPERLIDLVDIVGDTLGLIEKLLGAYD